MADIVSVAIYGAKKNGLIDTSRLLCNALPATQKMSFTNEVQVNQDSLSFWVAVTLKDTVSLDHRVQVNCNRVKTTKGNLKILDKTSKTFTSRSSCTTERTGWMYLITYSRISY